jgi:hypothetical protein
MWPDGHQRTKRREVILHVTLKVPKWRRVDVDHTTFDQSTLGPSTTPLTHSDKDMPPKRASRAKASKADESQDVVMAGDAPDAVVPDVAIAADQGSLKSILEKSAKRTRELFAEDQESLYITPTEDQTRYTSCEKA